MSHINVTINGRQYRMACEEGQEVRLLKLAESLESRVGELRGKFGEIGDARLTVMAALTVCDELLDANQRMRALEEELENLRNVRAAATDRARTTQIAVANALNAAADGAVEDLRGLFDALGGRVQRVGHRDLGRAGAIGGDDADIAQRVEFFFEHADAAVGVEQFIARRQRRHHGQARIADLAELAAQAFDPRFQTLGKPQQPRLLSLLAGHPVLPAVDGDIDVAHEVSPASSTERMVPIAASSRSAISRLARSSLRDFTSDPSSSSASRDRSAPSA